MGRRAARSNLRVNSELNSRGASAASGPVCRDLHLRARLTYEIDGAVPLPLGLLLPAHLSGLYPRAVHQSLAAYPRPVFIPHRYSHALCVTG
jgi:hypothetical protein